ncbi:MAG: 5'/3'-nucleotidase SurE [Nevskiaceae bacterium]|nr:MAG: 5'/3'-nucleotidase SurE [Nevskiaceae bacterium]TBR73621.1 MAG: 5'/3'-nucleotidase SurE [Nevskiaceae bacterium]
MKLDGQRVLITNDDGIHAPGIRLLEKLVRRHTDDVWVVAPGEEHSGASHAISMHDPVRVRKIDAHHFAIHGTPTDCALMGIYELMPEPPTLLLSGINWGENLAEDLLYSGTAATAMEGALLGIPSVAFSQVHTYDEVHWETAEAFLPRVLERVLAAGIEPGTFVNVNFPPLAPNAVTGIRVTDQGRRAAGSFRPERRVDARTRPYWWIKITYLDRDQRQAGTDARVNTDLRAIAEGAVSVTPVQLDLTARNLKQRFADALKVE